MGFSVGLAGTRCIGTLCPPRPRPFQSLLLLLWTLLNCVLGSSAQGPGEWTPWGSWSHCSSSCGRGVSVRSRRCIRPVRRLPGEEPCWESGHEYRVCQLPDCPPGAVPFRDLQCALYNGHPVLGTQKIYQWIPFHGAPNQCDLNCLAEGHAFYHSFGRVLDGTPCSPGAQGLCVAGRCLSAGCDGVLGSGALEDRCGRCGGANDSCLFVQRVFRDAGAFAGYWNVTLIPEGARHIRVAHRSRNHLALMGVDGHYVLNGNWEILLQEPNPGIQFEFWLPRERYGPFQVQTQALGWPVRQPQPREVEARAPIAPPPLMPTLAPDPCPPCPDTRGRAHRLLHYCGSDFVFQARVVGRHRQAQETRYEVHIQLIYKSRWPLRTRETGCCCPMLATPGPGALLRTAASGWLPSAVLSEPLEETYTTDSKKDPMRKLKLSLFPLLPWLQGCSEIPTTCSGVIPCHK
ncbi:ADAMTS-like protein 5 isoform X6 [Marmota monax]|uniref:ADAMTS-like protein 5 isoform X6 n=1 Tax=Marmota monax TaxID=9995 RepID=UPI0026EEE97E|nr:ADAMTS-like protein 5 isoform X6 [Marmota monax]